MKDNKDVKMMPYYLIKGSQEEFNKMMNFPTTRQYKVVIRPTDWVYLKDEKCWYYEKKEVKNKYGEKLRERCSVMNISIGEERTYKENRAIDKNTLDNYFDMIYNNGLIRLSATDPTGKFRWLSEDKPKYRLCLTIEEIPVKDTVKPSDEAIVSKGVSNG